jgi:hypothetical protein
MLERWLRCLLYYSNTLSSGGLASTALIPPVMEAMVLILDVVAGIVLQLQRDLPRTAHLLDALQPPQSLVRGHQIPTAVDRLAKTAAVWKGGREALEDPLLGGGMLLRWLRGAKVLLPGNSSELVALTRSMLLQQPVAAGPVVLTVDKKVARQVRAADSVFMRSHVRCSATAKGAMMCAALVTALAPDCVP